MLEGTHFGGSRAFRLSYPAATSVGQGKNWRRGSSFGGIPFEGCLIHTARGRVWVRGGRTTLPPPRSGRVRIGARDPLLGESCAARLSYPHSARARVGKRREDYPAAASVGQGKNWWKGSCSEGLVLSGCLTLPPRRSDRVRIGGRDPLSGESCAARLSYTHSAGARVGKRREDYPAATSVGQGKNWWKGSCNGGIPV